ncbi:aromatic acid exporter family protein [Viridibacillus sp. YIM B01967]|uniref:Aromatic acid exporter family protein n=1 Tax=Viridibacillus soli TaxID=2798301 RepID=A0ABS1H3T4_9BACL|nr:aromatic acid exporter family protein [Viridibacillus soli]MBK3494079.1 aromatic acid exporter family protein [Viridibacillus soli]
MLVKGFSIGYRTLKTAIGAAVSIGLAQFFGLEFFTSAGILTILCIQTTKKKSMNAVYTRALASIVGMIMAFFFFEGVAYHPLVLGCMILLFLPILVMLKVTPGFVSSVVIILHIFHNADFTADLLVNELLLMLIGFGTGLAVNMYMPDIQHRLNKYRIRIEELYSVIFVEIVKYLRDGDTSWDGKELVEANEVINRGKSLAYQDVENHLSRREDLYYMYFDVREQQLEIIERVLPKITNLPVIVEQAELVADFMEDLSQNVHSGNTASKYREKLDAVKVDFAKLSLPSTHENFLAMASLYQFIEEMDHYLAIKQTFKGLNPSHKRFTKNEKR